MNRKILFSDLGTADYQQCWDYQQSLLDTIVSVKVRNRNVPSEDHEPTPNYLLFCEHPHVYTLGKSGSAENLLADDHKLKEINASFYKINRGGDITYHGPGQIVGYPVMDLENFFTDLNRYLRQLEESIILTLAEYGIAASRCPGYTGVWLDPDQPDKARKICAIGVRMSRWVTMHGFAFNVNSNLAYFSHIIPCGIDDKQVTSMQRELGKPVDLEEVKKRLKNNFAQAFDAEITTGKASFC